MEFKSNIEAVIEKFKNLANNSQNIDFTEALAVGVNAAMGQMKFRVFNTGRDAKGLSFGKYIGKKTRVTNRKYRLLKYGSLEREKEKKVLRKKLQSKIGDDVYSEYEKIRLSQGRQIIYKDLELTGSLRRGIVIVNVSATKVIAAIPNDRLFQILGYQQTQISNIIGQSVDIVGLSNTERDLMVSNINEALRQLYSRLFNI